VHFNNVLDQQRLIVNRDYFQLSLFTPYSYKATFSHIFELYELYFILVKVDKVQVKNEVFIKFELHNYGYEL